MGVEKYLAKSALSKLGLLPHFLKLRRFAEPESIPVQMMKFPTYSLDTNKSLASMIDYFRYATVALAIQRIITENISGCFAEAGVYQGYTSRFIHLLAPERLYYLFDTFEGFPQQDLGADRCDNRFKQTSVAEVLRYIGDASNIVVKKGYIPNTFKGLENECFAFALLDLDLYIPTIKSLEFFYPRLPQGGYLMIHDYNNPESNWGCKRAVDEFMSGKLESIMEIADEYGTVMFRKI
jgi:O-methyltransferase